MMHYSEQLSLCFLCREKHCGRYVSRAPGSKQRAELIRLVQLLMSGNLHIYGNRVHFDLSLTRSSTPRSRAAMWNRFGPAVALILEL